MKRTYRFLPFRFERRNGTVLLVNDVGEYLYLSEESFRKFIDGHLDHGSSEFLDLKAKHMLWDDHLPETLDLLATRYRTRKKFLFDFTSLHMFVITHRCNQKCLYCHASSVAEDSGSRWDMDHATARKCVELAFRSPSPGIKIEFQGGEPLLNFGVLKEIVEYAEELNRKAQKELEFVICTNLLALDETKLEYIKSKGIYLSTSLDGPAQIHDSYRKIRAGNGSHERVISNLDVARRELGAYKISALMTITPESLSRLREVIDEYLKQGLGSIFLRMMNPFGGAAKDWANLGYSVEAFLKAYRDALDYIIEINLQGTHFPEEYATLLLSRILTPYSTGFVDLQSPAGVGIGGVIYDTGGDVFVSDEARMLYRSTDDKRFCIGNAHVHSWSEIFGGPQLREIIASSCIESLPGCAWCVFQPYCGSDPVRNYAVYDDMIGRRPQNDFCRKHRGLFRLLFDYLLCGNDDVEDVFWAWITGRNVNEVQGHCRVEML